MEGGYTQEKFIDEAAKASSEKRPTILIFKDSDGNWRGGTHVNEQFVNVRDVGPETVLQLLLTHDGKSDNA